MEKKKKIGLIGIALIALAVGGGVWWWQSQSGPMTRTDFLISKVADRQQIQLSIGDGSALRVEVVNTPGSKSQGLSGRDQIGADGMLFIMDGRGIPSFWMKDMKFDLDLIWIDGEMVVEITPNVPRPAPGVQDQNLPVYAPTVPAEWVLELPAGEVERRGIKVGQKVRLFP